MPKYKRVLLKLSGEALKNSSDKGIIDFDFTAKVAEQIKRCTDEGVSFGLVIGGGNIWRGAGKWNGVGLVTSGHTGEKRPVSVCVRRGNYGERIFRSKCPV